MSSASRSNRLSNDILVEGIVKLNKSQRDYNRKNYGHQYWFNIEYTYSSNPEATRSITNVLVFGDDSRNLADCRSGTKVELCGCIRNHDRYGRKFVVAENSTHYASIIST